MRRPTMTRWLFVLMPFALMVVALAPAEDAHAAPVKKKKPAGCSVVTYTPPKRDVSFQGDLCVPKTNPTRSAVVIAHGAGAISAKDPTRKTLKAWSDYYTKHGVLSLNIDFTQAVAPGPTYPAPIVDEKSAVQYLRLHARELGIDPDHIIVQGHSGGARMGANVLVSPDDPYFTKRGEWPDVSDAANGFIGFYGAYRGAIGDPSGYQIFYGGPLNSTDPVVRERLDHANSIAHAGDASGPVLLIHGDTDQLAPVVASQAFATALKTAGVDTQLVIVPGASHGFDIDRATLGLSTAGVTAAQQCLAWIEQHFG